MAKSYRYCIICEAEVEFTWTDGDRPKCKEFPAGWFCCTCDWKLDERKVRHIEAKLDLQNELIQIKDEISKLNKKSSELQKRLNK